VDRLRGGPKRPGFPEDSFPWEIQMCYPLHVAF